MKKTTEEAIKDLHDEINCIRRDVSQIIARRTTNENTRFCVWDGQSDDGRKHAEDLGKEALPFENASDGRIRTADKIINEHVDECVLAAMRTIPKVKGIEGTKEYQAGKMMAILKCLRGKWGSDFRTQMELLVQYSEGDTPAAALLKVDWVKEKALEMRTIKPQELLLMVTNEMADSMTDDLLVDVANMVENPQRIDELKNLLKQLYPNLSGKTVDKVASDLQTKQEAEFPMPYLRKNYPVMKALRLYEDVFMRPNIKEFDRAPYLIFREWLSKAEVKERAATEKWNKDFVSALIGEDDDDTGKEKMSAFDEPSADMQSRSTGMSTMIPREGLYELLTAYEYETDDDGIMGIWVTVFSGLIEDSVAKEPELYDRAHGKYPGVLFSRENVTARKLDSRSVSELSMTHQNAQKLTHDAGFDHVQVMTNPPLKTGVGRPKFQVTLAPFGQVEQGPRETVEFLQRPPFPQAAQWMSDKLAVDIDEYFGRPNKVLPDSLAIIKSQARIDRFLSSLKDAYAMVIQLVMQFMTDEEIAKITGPKGMPIARTVEEIQGQYDLELSFDVKDLDADYVIKKGEFYLNIVKALDNKSTVQWDKGVRRLVEAMDPTGADEMLLPSEEADAREAKDEKVNFAMIVAGMEPDMTEGGINSQLRLQVLQEEIAKRQQNPQAFYPMSPASMAILENRMKYLEFQGQQQQNAQTGKMGTEPIDLNTVGQPSGGQATVVSREPMMGGGM